LLNYIKHNKYAELNPDCFSKLFLVALGNRTNIRKEGFLIPEVKAGLQELVSDTAADEVIVVTDSMNRRNWLDSYRPVAKIARTIEVKSTASVEA